MYSALALGSVVCCIGTMSRKPGMASCDVLWLFLFLTFLPTASGVCTSCFGDEPSCAGDADTCPWQTVLASNVAAVAGASGALIALEKVLPNKFVRLFSRSVLHTLSTMLPDLRLGLHLILMGRLVTKSFQLLKGTTLPRMRLSLNLC